MKSLTVLMMFVAAGLVAGCGSEESARTDFPQEELEVQYAKSVRAMIGDLKKGESGVEPSTVQGLEENLSAYKSEAVGENEETYKQIYEGVQELNGMVKGSASSAEVETKVDELIALTDKLPGGGSGGGDESSAP